MNKYFTANFVDDLKTACYSDCERASVDVRFLLGVQQSGSFKFYFNVEALP